MNNQKSILFKLKHFNTKNVIITNSLILVFSSMVIKIISLLNRIFLTRLLGNMGIAVYTLILPTVMLFISIGGFSLNNTVTKLISDNNTQNKKYTDYDILCQARKISLISSLITIIIFICSIYFITHHALKRPETLTPLFYTILFIPLTALNNVYRGYVAGKNQMNKLAIATIIEQISRFFITIILLYAFNSFGTYFSVMLTILAMCFGELISLLYILHKCKKIEKVKSKENKKKLTKKIVNLSLSTTITHLISNIAMFLEPIIFTYSLANLNVSTDDILLKYSEINSFVIPTLTLLSFISYQYSQAIFPILSKSYTEKNYTKISSLINKSLSIMISIGIFISITFYFYANDILIFLYDTNTGKEFVEKLSLIFILSYVTPIFIAILQATNNYGYIFKCSLFTTIIKLLLIYILSILNVDPNNILPITIIVYIVISFILYFVKIIKIVKFKIPVTKTIFLFFCCIFIFFFTSYFNFHFILNILFATIIYSVFCYFS